MTAKERERRRLLREGLRVLSDLHAACYGSDGPERSGLERAIRNADEAAALVADMAFLLQEQLRVILLDTRSRVLDVVTVYQGNVSSAIVRAAEVFRPAIIANAPNLIIAHNHPSGDPSPSTDDINLTRQLVQGGRLLGIDVLDSIVIGNARRSASIREAAPSAWERERQ